MQPPTPPPARAGLTLVEVMVALGIVAAVVALAIPSWTDWIVNQRTKEAARGVADLLSVARTEAIRTGRNHAVLFQSDPGGALLQDADGDVVPVLVVRDDDGPGPLPDPNGQPDAGEARIPGSAAAGVNWGVTQATAAAPGDPDPNNTFATGLTFRTPANAPARWIVFAPDGVPRGYSTGPYVEGTIGTGGGAVYLTNGERDYAVVLTPLGGVQVSAWDPSIAGWRN